VKRLQNNRKTIGLLLAFLLVLPFAVRMEHVYHCSVYDNGEQLHHDCSTCAICRFSFSLFTESESFEFKITPKYVEYEIPVFDSRITVSFPFSYHLRAPPFLM
jgi:hypothetical protein